MRFELDRADHCSVELDHEPATALPGHLGHRAFKLGARPRATKWAEAAFAELARPVHGKQAPLRRTNTRPQRRPPGSPPPATTRPSTTGTVLRLADYLEQHGRNTRRMLCPPSSFWAAAHTHLTHPNDLNNLANEARNRYRLQWAHHLASRAIEAGNTSALRRLVEMWERAEDLEVVEALARQIAHAAHADAPFRIARLQRRRVDHEAAEALYRQAAATGDLSALSRWAEMMEQAGDHEGAAALIREGVEALARQAADAGSAYGLTVLAEMKERAGDYIGAEALARQAADAGSTYALAMLAELSEQAGDHEGAEALARQAADAGHRSFLLKEWWPYGLDPDGTPTLPWSVAGDAT